MLIARGSGLSPSNVRFGSKTDIPVAGDRRLRRLKRLLQVSSGAYPVLTFGILALRWVPLSAGEPCWIRTSDLLIKSQLLYRLS
jgi:hypothetical protein